MVPEEGNENLRVGRPNHAADSGHVDPLGGYCLDPRQISGDICRRSDCSSGRNAIVSSTRVPAGARRCKRICPASDQTDRCQAAESGPGWRRTAPKRLPNQPGQATPSEQVHVAIAKSIEAASMPESDEKSRAGADLRPARQLALSRPGRNIASAGTIVRTGITAARTRPLQPAAGKESRGKPFRKRSAQTHADAETRHERGSGLHAPVVMVPEAIGLRARGDVLISTVASSTRCRPPAPDAGCGRDVGRLLEMLIVQRRENRQRNGNRHHQRARQLPGTQNQCRRQTGGDDALRARAIHGRPHEDRSTLNG